MVQIWLNELNPQKLDILYDEWKRHQNIGFADFLETQIPAFPLIEYAISYFKQNMCTYGWTGIISTYFN